MASLSTIITNENSHFTRAHLYAPLKNTSKVLANYSSKHLPMKMKIHQHTHSVLNSTFIQPLTFHKFINKPMISPPQRFQLQICMIRKGSSEVPFGRLAKLKFINSPMAPMDENKLTVFLELTGVANVEKRPGLDLVTVLDVSGSMKGDRLRKLKKTMQLIISKIRPIDRLSIITFSNSAKKVCDLRQVNEKSQVEIIDLVSNIKAEGWTNIEDGLQTAVDVLQGRSYAEKLSVGAIMLVSDGEQNRGGDAREVEVGDVPVYTFSYGTSEDRDHKAMTDVLNSIARNSNGGTFSDVQKTDNLSSAFAQCLAGLQSIAVQDSKLIISPLNNAKIKNVFAGNYKSSKNNGNSPVMVNFGYLYDNEARKIIVDLVLPKVSDEISLEVLEVGHKYINEDKTKEMEAPPVSARVKRIKAFTPEEWEEVNIEESRLETVKMMKEARILADVKRFEDAKNMILKAQNRIAMANIDGVNNSIEMLKAEIQQFMIYLQTPESYEKNGRIFALSLELSHERQRFAARDDMEKLRMYSTPLMDEYHKEAKVFDNEVKEVFAVDPIDPMDEALVKIQSAMQTLKDTRDMLVSVLPR